MALNQGLNRKHDSCLICFIPIPFLLFLRAIDHAKLCLKPNSFSFIMI